MLQAGSLRFAQLFEGCTVLTKGTRWLPDTLVVVEIEMLPPVLAKVEDKWEIWSVISVPPYNVICRMTNVERKGSRQLTL